MGKLIVWNIMSLDGYFEGEQPWDLAMHETIWGPELEALSKAQLADTEALVFGRRTYEGMAAYWRDETGEIAEAMNALPKIVVSNTLSAPQWNNTSVVSGDIVPQLARIKAEAARTLYVFGSAELLATLLPAGLVDEYRLGLAPVLLGAGNPLFKSGLDRLLMPVARVQPLHNGGAVLYLMPGNVSAEQPS